MTISINPVSPAQNVNQAKKEKKTDKREISSSSKVILSALALAGITTLAVVGLKTKKGVKKPDLKNLAKKSPKVKNMTQEEKEKFIKEMQAKTDNPNTKEEIRKLVESGEWDSLG